MPVVWGVDPGITARWGPHWIVRSPGAGNRLSRQITVDGVMGYVSGVPIGISSVDAHCQATGEALSPVTGALLATLPPVPLVRSDATR